MEEVIARLRRTGVIRELALIEVEAELLGDFGSVRSARSGRLVLS